MASNYAFKVNPSAETFSSIPSGDEIKFLSTNFNPLFTFQNGDNLIVFKEPGTYYLFKIIDNKDGELTLFKNLEIYSSYFLQFPSGITLLKLENDEYADLLGILLSHFDIEKKAHKLQGELFDGYNKIYFGAPGTGKSYAVSQIVKNIPEEQIERVIFHPDYDYASFVGGYKPVTKTVLDANDNPTGKTEVRYEFQPQVFTDIYVKAHQNSDKNYYLVIEEINRGNCAEIFGDVFQLLDRNPDYKVTPSKDLYNYLNETVGFGNKGFEEGKMTMPENLILLATMNTSDQSLYPMDSAFKRRWQWEYVPIRYASGPDDDSCKSFGYRIKVDDGLEIRWSDFMEKINSLHILENPSLGMDKCLGNFFIQPTNGNYIDFEAFVNKVMFYLWNDVFREEENYIFRKEGYSALFPVNTAGKEFFRNLVLEVLKIENLAHSSDEDESKNNSTSPYDAEHEPVKQVAEDRETDLEE